MRDLRPGDDLGADIDAITRAAQRGAALTGQLLIFSRGQAGHPETVHLNKLVADAARAVAAALPDRVRLVTRLAADLSATRIDPAGVPQIVQALAGPVRRLVAEPEEQIVPEADGRRDARLVGRARLVAPGAGGAAITGRRPGRYRLAAALVVRGRGRHE
jgi:signal transduction histidine kinase